MIGQTASRPLPLRLTSLNEDFFYSVITTVITSLIVLVLNLSLSPAMASEQCKTIRLAFSENWYPISYYDEKGNVDGVAIRLHQKIFAELGVKPEFIGNIPFKRQLFTVEKGKLDAVAALNFTSERAKQFHLTDSFHSFAVRAFGLKRTDFTIESVDDLRKHSVVYSRGASFGEEFDQIASESARFSTINGTDSIVEIVGSGRADLFILPDYLGEHLIEQSAYAGQLTMLGPPIYVQNVHMAFSKSSPCSQLLDRYNETLNRLQKEGMTDVNAVKDDIPQIR